MQFAAAELTVPDSWRLSRLLRAQAGSISVAAAVGARLVLLDGAVQRVVLGGLGAGRAVLWRAGGSSEAQKVVFEARQNLPWPPCHLRVTGGTAASLRRSADIPDSWAFPDDAAGGRFAAEFVSGSGFGGRLETNLPSCPVPEGTLTLRVAEVGPEGRTGLWLSIGPGSPYL